MKLYLNTAAQLCQLDGNEIQEGKENGRICKRNDPRYLQLDGCTKQPKEKGVIALRPTSVKRKQFCIMCEVVMGSG
jgi:hypothetical protein